MPRAPESTSSRACIACHKYKRRCDKALPSCSLCKRLQKVCEYAPSETGVLLHARLRDLEAHVKTLTGTHSAEPSCSSANGLCLAPFAVDDFYPDSLPFQNLFLDPELETHAESGTLPSSECIPPSVYHHVGDQSQRARVMAAYFETVHHWAPVLGKIRLLTLVNAKKHDELPADIALLILAMKLAQSIPPDSSGALRDALYITTKKYAATLDILGVYSLAKLQANILIALYEMGHGIFPAGYASMGNCVTQALALGIHHKDAPQMLKSPCSWMDWEERQRVWWLIVILDRYLTAAAVNKPLLSPDPKLTSHLPADDKAWDLGESVLPERLLLSSAKYLSKSPFARLCQAAHLLGEVVKHCNDDSRKMIDVKSNIEVLSQTLFSFLQVLSEDDASVAHSYSAAAVCLSALLKLCNHHSCDSFTTYNERSLCVEDIAIAREISLTCQTRLKIVLVKVTELADVLLQSQDLADPVRLSPWLLDCIYQAIANFIYISSTMPRDKPSEYEVSKERCTRLLSWANTRWKVAGAYLVAAGLTEQKYAS